MKKIIISLFLQSTIVVNAQIGCTDSQAINFNPLASENDGSCLYNLTNYSTSIVSSLASNISESSALLFRNNDLFTLNDSGGFPTLYRMDTLGTLQQEIFINGAYNIDWEALAISETSIFIGDFGNNNGIRQDLSIYVISLSQLLNNPDTLSAERMVFKYGDQQGFSSAPNATNFDAEAFVFFQDSLHIFSKSWQTNYCKHYVLPAMWQDTAIALLKDSILINGLITDATIDKETGRLLLLGYKLDSPVEGGAYYSSFVHLLFDYPQQNFFRGNNRRIELGGVLSLGQTEGISWSTQNKGFITAEKISSPIEILPKLRSFDFEEFFSQEQTGMNEGFPATLTYFYKEGVIYVKSEWDQLYLFNFLGQELNMEKTENGWVSQMVHSGIHFLFADNQWYKILIN